jgi:hypothetical protein
MAHAYPYQRWHTHYHTLGSGPVYQGRIQSFPVQENEHFYHVMRYVERNAQRAKLVQHAESWRGSSLWRRQHPYFRWGLGHCLCHRLGSRSSIGRRPKPNGRRLCGIA